MNTIKLYLTTSGRVADMHKDFPLFQGQFQNKLLNVYVPTSILAPQYSAQYYIGNTEGNEMPTDEELTLFVKTHTADSREPINGDVIEFTYLGETPSTFWLYIYNNNEWTSQQVDSLGTTNSIDGTSVQIGMLANKRNGVIYESKKYFMRYLKTLTYQNVEYAMYERKLPKEFTKFVGQGESSPIMIFNVVDMDLQENVITRVITSQYCHLDVMPSTDLDQDPDIEEPTELDRLSAEVDILNAQMPTKQDKVDSSININAIVSTQNVVGAINDISSAVSTNTIDIGDNRADIALLDANKQDKSDNNLETTDKTVVGAINELNTQVRINTTNIGTNTYDISALDTRVAHVEDVIGSGEDYIGAMSGTLDPTDLEDFAELSSDLNDFVLERRPSVEGGDVVIYTQLIEHGTDKNYKFIYSGAEDGWTYYEIPPIEKAGNDTYGIIKGSYDAEDTTTKTQVNIVNGEIKDITMIDSLGQHQDIADYVNTQAGKITTLRTDVNVHTGEIALNAQHIQSNTNAIGTLDTTVGNIIDGTTAVGYAKQAEKDSLNRNIAQTYMTQNLGATKQQLYDYALPRTFNDVSFVGADNEFVDVVPDSETALYNATSTLVGDTQLFYVEKTIDNAYFELANKNSYNDTLYVSASADCTVTFKVTTQVYHNAQWTTINTELTEPVTFESGVIRRVEFGSTMNSLNQVLDVIPEDKIRQTFEIQTTVSTPITFSVYSNETYPSAFYLNTTSQVIIVAQGALGEMPVYILTGTSVEGDIVFTIPSEREFNSNVNSLYQLTYSGVVQETTRVRLSKSGVNIRLETPYNYGSLDDAKVADLTQVSVVDTEQLHTWLFTAVTKESGGEKYLVVSEDNLTDLSNIVASKVDANTAITGATKTKITYDSKGLVTGGADLQESDIPTLSTSKISGLDTEIQQIATNKSDISSLLLQTATNTTDISTINGKIPAQASSSNQLADKSFVNSSIASNTANFIGTFADIPALNNYDGTVTNNDYAFVVNSVITDNGNDWATFNDLDAYDKTLLTEFDYAWVINGSNFDLYRFDVIDQEWNLRVSNTAKSAVTLNTAYNRYKATVSGSTVTWAYEYTLNNSSFTASQWASINSGITSADVTQIGTNQTNISGLSTDKADKTYVDSNFVSVNEQTLTDEQKAQARANIGAGSASATTVLVNGVAQSSVSFDSDPQTQITSLENNKQDTLTAGNGISLASNTISWNNTISAELDTTGTTSCYVTIQGASGQEFPRPIKLFVQVRYSKSGSDKPLVDTYIISTESLSSGSVQILSNKYTSGFYRAGGFTRDEAILIQFSNYTSSQRPTNIYISALSPYDVSTLTITKTNGTPSNTPVNVFTITNISKEFFDVVYNTTPYIDIDTAYNSGKLLICKKTDGTEYFGVYGIIGFVNGIPQYGYIFNSITAINAPKLIISGFTVNSSNVWTTFSNTLGTASSKDTGTTDGTIPLLGTDGKLPSSVIPASAITDTFVVNSQNAMLGLTNAKVGDVCVRTDINKSFILKAEPYSTLANWQELLTPTDAVISVNSQTGAVVLSASDVSALPSSTKYGASLSVSGTSVQLKDQDGNNLGSAITTQDTTYSLATTSANGLLRQLNSSSVSTQTQSTKFLREDGTWQAPSYTPTTSSITSGSTAALTSGGAYTNLVSDVTYDSTNKKLKKTKGGSTTDLVTFGANAFNSTTIPTSYVSSVNGSTGAITGIVTTSDMSGFVDFSSYSQLYSTDSVSTGSKQLNYALNLYDIMVVGIYNTNAGGWAYGMIPTWIFINNNNTSSNYWWISHGDTGQARRTAIYYVDATHIYIANKDNITKFKIWGLRGKSW